MDLENFFKTGNVVTIATSQEEDVTSVNLLKEGIEDFFDGTGSVFHFSFFSEMDEQLSFNLIRTREENLLMINLDRHYGDSETVHLEKNTPEEVLNIVNDRIKDIR